MLLVTFSVHAKVATCSQHFVDGLAPDLIQLETNGTIAYVQTMIGQGWVKKADLYPQGVMGCDFENGHYVPGRLE